MISANQDKVTLKPSILGATWLFLQVNAPARLSAAIARGFFCWLGRCYFHILHLRKTTLGKCFFLEFSEISLIRKILLEVKVALPLKPLTLLSLLYDYMGSRPKTGTGVEWMIPLGLL